MYIENFLYIIYVCFNLRILSLKFNIFKNVMEMNKKRKKKLP